MRRFGMLVASAALLVACQQKIEPTESVESLVANPERLAELRTQCRQDHARVGDAQCSLVAEATRLRFLGKGGSSYAGDPIRPPKPPAETAGSTAGR